MMTKKWYERMKKCKFYNNGWCELPESRDDIRYKPCGDMTLSDCYFKQLDMEKEEHEKVKKEYAQCLEDIEYLINKIDTTMGCTYGDYDCDRCSDTGDTICEFKLKNLILQKIKEISAAKKKTPT